MGFWNFDSKKNRLVTTPPPSERVDPLPAVNDIVPLRPTRPPIWSEPVEVIVKAGVRVEKLSDRVMERGVVLGHELLERSLVAGLSCARGCPDRADLLARPPRAAEVRGPAGLTAIIPQAREAARRARSANRVLE